MSSSVRIPHLFQLLRMYQVPDDDTSTLIPITEKSLSEPIAEGSHGLFLTEV